MIRANHYNFNKLLGQKGIIETIKCDCGIKKENIDYIIHGCKKCKKERQFTFRNIEGGKKRICLKI